MLHVELNFGCIRTYINLNLKNELIREIEKFLLLLLLKKVQQKNFVRSNLKEFLLFVFLKFKTVLTHVNSGFYIEKILQNWKIHVKLINEKFFQFYKSFFCRILFVSFIIKNCRFFKWKTFLFDIFSIIILNFTFNDKNYFKNVCLKIYSIGK
jgi:hypothetical protein